MAASKNPLVRLGHVRDEIAELTRALDGLDFPKFVEAYVLRRATEHAILIISEAVKALPTDLTDGYPGVDWRAIRDIGNVLRHDYFAVEPLVLWRIVTDRLPELKAVVDRMIVERSR